MTLTVFDVCMADLPKEEGCVQYGIRPVIILECCTYNYILGKPEISFRCIPTTAEYKPNQPTHCTLRADECCLTQDSIVLAEQTRTVSADNIIRRLGNIYNRRHRFMIAKAMGVAVGLSPKTFSYSYDFLFKVKADSQFIQAYMQISQKKLDYKYTMSLVLAEVEKAKERIRVICNERNIRFSRYIDDLYRDNINFDLV